MRILIIDEEPNIRSVLVCAVEPEHSAIAVDCWAEATSSLEKQNFDVVLLDLHLTTGDGLECLSALTLGCSCSAVIAYSTSAQRDEALRRGAFGFLTQPFTPAELRAELARVPRPCGQPRSEVRAASMSSIEAQPRPRREPAISQRVSSYPREKPNTSRV